MVHMRSETVNMDFVEVSEPFSSRPAVTTENGRISNATLRPPSSDTRCNVVDEKAVPFRVPPVPCLPHETSYDMS